ncbi:MAG: PTS sugar transporter subunit IIB [Erysipelotrichaceae bacterium]|nr:PTS sugar transporter subunit IIB [Erysipelotrichaceae bacterium]
MVSIIIASHGEFANGLLNTAGMLMGSLPDVHTVCLYPSEGPDTFREKVLATVALCESENVLFMVDLWGGTPCNQIQLLLENHKKWAMVAGVNVPLLLDAYTKRDWESAKDVAAAVMGEASDSIRASVEAKKKEETVEETDNETGRMEYVLARIDSRLLHGQVATSWTKATRPNRILVVSDTVSKDNLRKTLIQQAAPVGVKAHVVPVSKILEVDKDVRFAKVKAMLLFETVQDCVRAVEGGLSLTSVNLGSLAHTEGKVAITDAVSLDLQDVEGLEYLMNQGIEIDIRKVVTDSKGNIDDVLQQARKGLNV